ncbi:cardiolipin synthase ClsB [Alcaligenes endophyticus]|uniref:Cardiolipin synthase B n=1 Tax=Alcaligenes endophyticus TaxID=1929088 RepID=A0ABT8EFE7_9BURK|nr:cardiolipin synthase ClsB [Alcaligenes endophyticus]MCX5590340.1 cardiolipin synthase ClsB [Alcaligenes endophyticus]MDN4119996.1 cardiolipin synthase ClsB [Alcaligenes endophyticus]
MSKLLRRLSWTTGNQVELLHNGGEFFPALCLAIDQAQVSVHLETYIFRLDHAGQAVLDSLKRACARGVRVRVVVDGFGSAKDLTRLAEQFARMKARFRIYRPPPRAWRDSWLSLRRLRRLHRKVAVIDGTIGFVGGINILDDFQDVPNVTGQASPRFDFAVRCTGPVVAGLERAQYALWLRMSWRRRTDWDTFTQRFQLWAQRRQQRLRMRYQSQVTAEGRTALLLRDNVRHRQSIERAYLHLLAQASEEVIIANAYFFPGRRLRKALKQAALRGVRVRLLLQGHAEYFWQYRASCALYQELLDNGLELYEYQASYLHAKVAVIDGYAMVGSSNLDPFSLLLAREANLLLADTDFTRRLRTILEHELSTHASQVAADVWLRRGWLGRWVDTCAYGLLRLGVLLTGKSSRY